LRIARDTNDMITPDVFATAERSIAVVDLIGDLDATLGTILAETLDTLVASGTTHVVVSAKHVATSSYDGLESLGAACTAARASGATVALDPGNRRMRAAFEGAALAIERQPKGGRPSGTRHLMIAHHAPAKRLAYSA